MKRLLPGSIKLWLVLIFSSLFLLACDVGSLIPGGIVPGGQATGQAQPQPTTSGGSGSASSTSVPAVAKDAQSRISDSMNRVLIMDKKVLDSYHLEVSGTSPTWNKTKVEPQPFSLSADVAGDDVHYNKTQAGKPSEGYIIDMNGKDGGKGYAVEGGQLKDNLFASLGWVTLPLEYGMPLIFASMGPTPRGDEAVDGRAAEKFDVDLAKAPTGAEGTLKGMGFGMSSSKGTVWIDKQNGALLKMTIDYVSDVMDAGKVVGQGNGHIDWMVTKVGQVTVKVPDANSFIPATPPTVRGGTVVPTSALKGPTTPTPTAAPTASIAKVGQRVISGGVALTVTKVDQVATYGGKKADTGYTWVIATITVENTSNAKITVEEEQFDYVDKDGSVVNGLLNGPSAPGNTGSTVLGMSTINAGGKLAGKTLPIQVKTATLQGLQLLFTIDDSHSITVNLGLPKGPSS